MKSKRFLFSVSFVVAALFCAGWAQTRSLQVDDLFQLKRVADPQISPDGKWVAFTVSQMNLEKDKSDTDLYMISTQGGEPRRLTTSPEPETRPRWSPDNRYLAFLSGREGKKNQVWLLDRQGGEAQKLTSMKGSISSFTWSPDSRRLALVMRDPKDQDIDDESDKEEEKDKTPEPIVITRLQFKQDGRGYLDDRRAHLYIFDLETRDSFQLTEGPYEHESPVWSPDGSTLAFVSNRTEEPDSNFNQDIFLVAAERGATPRKLTTSAGRDTSPSFSPDGAQLVYVAGGPPEDIWYATDTLAVVDVESGASRSVAPELDRNIRSPRFSADGQQIYFLLEDYGSDYLAAVPAEGGEVRRLAGEQREIGEFDLGPDGLIVVRESTLEHPPELSKLNRQGLQRLTGINDEFLKGIKLGSVRSFEATSKDGTVIQAFLTLPPDQPEGSNLPTILRIHGGPVSQFSHSFSFEWQLLAAHGYAVVAANPRGSSGRGRDFSYAIWADWGNLDFQDVMAAVDYVIQEEIADPERLGVGGWSYGGILTNYVITQTDRFKAAISGSSEVNYTANYGHDHYQRQWEAELGLPWEKTDLWLQISPFFKVDQISTPTLILCGEKDWNVPLQNSEQLYQALRRLGVPTELIIYPNQSHGIRVASYQKDRYQRYLDWYDKWLRPTDSTN